MLLRDVEAGVSEKRFFISDKALKRIPRRLENSFRWEDGAVARLSIIIILVVNLTCGERRLCFLASSKREMPHSNSRKLHAYQLDARK